MTSYPLQKSNTRNIQSYTLETLELKGVAYRRPRTGMLAELFEKDLYLAKEKLGPNYTVQN